MDTLEAKTILMQKNNTSSEFASAAILELQKSLSSPRKNLNYPNLQSQALKDEITRLQNIHHLEKLEQFQQLHLLKQSQEKQMQENQELMAKYIKVLNSNQEAIEERMLCEKELQQVKEDHQENLKKIQSENK